jgi:hypothetical protein
VNLDLIKIGERTNTRGVVIYQVKTKDFPKQLTVENIALLCEAEASKIMKQVDRESAKSKKNSWK